MKTILLFGFMLSLTLCAEEKSFNVRNYGAIGDGKNLDHQAINKAIDAAFAAGGGQVILPPGVYLSGSIRLKSNIHLIIEEGATLLGAPQELNAYDETEIFSLPAFQDGGHSFFRNSLIWGENLNNVTISGQGLINGGGLVENAEILNKMVGFLYTKDRVAHPERIITKENARPNNGMPPVRLGNKAISLKLCTNVSLKDFTISHGGWFGILATGCNKLSIDNLTIDTNRDGMDIDACSNVTITNCRVNAPMDDAICLKSSCGLGEIRMTENVKIDNCTVSGYEEGTLLDKTYKPHEKRGTGRIKLGTEASGGFRNITITNCTFKNCFGLALQMPDGGILENITVDNLKMTEIKNYAIFIMAGKRYRTPNPEPLSRIRNIKISNVNAEGPLVNCAIEIYGLPEQPAENLCLENIKITTYGGFEKKGLQPPKEFDEFAPIESNPLGKMPSYGIFARHVKDLRLTSISIHFKRPDIRPPGMFINIDGLILNNVQLQTASGIHPLEIAPNVRNITIKNSPELSSAHSP